MGEVLWKVGAGLGSVLRRWGGLGVGLGGCFELDH